MLLSVFGHGRSIRQGSMPERRASMVAASFVVLMALAACAGGGGGKGKSTFATVAELTAKLASAGIPCRSAEGFPKPTARRAFCASESGGDLDFIATITDPDTPLREQVREALDVEDVVLVGGNWIATEESGDVDLTDLQKVIGGDLVDDPAEIEQAA